METKSFRFDKRCAFVFSALLVLAASLAFFQVAFAQDGPPEDGFPSDNDVNAIAKNLYCPVCPNTPLDVCETKACEDWRAQIKDQLAAGWTEQQILDYFVAQYGERVLAEPQRPGFNSLVWMLPVIAVIFGLGFIWQVLKAWQKGAGQAVSAPAAEGADAAIPAEVLAKLEAELREMD